MVRQPVSTASIVMLGFLAVVASVLVPLWLVTLAYAPIPVFLSVQEKGRAVGGLVLSALVLVVVVLLEVAALPPVSMMLVLGYLNATVGPSFSPGFRVALAAIIITILFSLIGLAFFYIGRPAITERWNQETKTIKEQVLEQARGNDTYSESLEDEVDKVIGAAPYLFLGLTAVASIWLVGLNYFLTGRLAKAREYQWTEFPRFSHWQIPWYLAYGFILGLIGFLFNEYFGVYWFFTYAAGLNLLILFGALYSVQGLAVVYFYLEKYKVGAPVRVAVILAALTTQLLFQGISWLGVFDTWFDFRRLARPG